MQKKKTGKLFQFCCLAPAIISGKKNKIKKDMSFIGEELGLVLGTIPVLTLFILIFLRGLKIAKKCTDHFGVFLSLGIAFNLVLYAFVNAAVVTGILPVTGLPMPMVSYGGSGMVVNMAMMGILLNISQSRRSVVGSRSWSPAFHD